MRLTVSAVVSFQLLAQIVLGVDILVTRHGDGDIFIVEGSCTTACEIFSTGTASPYYKNTTRTIFDAEDLSCTCQCHPELPVFRDDLQICVSDIHECNAAGFVGESGLVEKVPYVFLPGKNQIIYPQAEIKFEGVKTPICGITGSQKLVKTGWLELRNLSNAEPPFRLLRDDGKTYLQWTGETDLRSESEGKIVLTKLVCRDAYPGSSYTGVFSPCVAFRVAGSSSRNGIREVTFLSNSRLEEGLSATEYTAIGLSSVLLALIYVVSVSLYLQSKKIKRKPSQDDAELVFPEGRSMGLGVVKNNLLLAARHFENENVSGPSDSDVGDELLQSDGEPGFDNVTAAIVHPNVTTNPEPMGGLTNPGTIVSERLPEENVRIVETAENQTQQQDTPVHPGIQRRKLYFNPAYFDRQLLLAPPPAAVEFLLKIREVIAIAKHKMLAKRFVPTLFGIAEEDSASERSVTKKLGRSIQGSVNGSVSQSKKFQSCTGCPGCTEQFYAPPLPDSSRAIPGENRVRAWLEDVKTLDRRWKDSETHKYPDNPKSLSLSLEYLKEMRMFDVSDSESVPMKNSPWRDNSSMLQSFRNIARSEILGTNDRHSVPGRSARSVIEDSNYRRQELSKNSSSMEEIAANVKIRRAIENSFMKQLEETAMLEQKKEQLKNAINATVTAPSQDTKVPMELPDMINELPKNPRKIMDAVIREMVVSKSIDKSDPDHPAVFDYEVDSLERTKNPRKISCSSTCSNNETASSTALPMDEELTMQNAVINAKTGEMTTSKLRRSNSEQSLNFSELVQKPENYSLVSEVYVNDGYDSPASDDSGPEIQYEPENPGHLMIKVHDSPENYIRQDESEYEPDTLDRKPMKLKVNEELSYQRSIKNESYMDSLERPGQILLKSSGSFKLQANNKPKMKRGLRSLREIYEARMKGQSIENMLVRDDHVLQIRNQVGEDSDSDKSWHKKKYLTPDSRQARRQRKPVSRPDVVPPPPAMEEFYQRPDPPGRIEEMQRFVIKNEKDRSCEKAGYPTTTNGTPVHAVPSACVGSRTWTKECAKHTKRDTKETSQEHLVKYDSSCLRQKKEIRPSVTTKTIRSAHKVPNKNLNMYRLAQNHQVKVDDSGYLSSADSSESQKQLLKSDTTEGSLSETDDTESICDGASESGAESIGTDSVFFGNFRKLSEASKFSKSTDSGVDVDTQNTFLNQPHLKLEMFPGSNLFNASDSEAESFVTVLAPNSRRRNSLVL